MVSRMNRRARAAVLAGLGLAGLAATSLMIHWRVPDIVVQASDRWRQHPRCDAALPAGSSTPTGTCIPRCMIGKYFQSGTSQIRINFEQTSASLG
jgi:hypothetical protein